MLTEYIEEAMKRARYERIEDTEAPFYGESPELPGVWASAATLDSCRRELKDTLEGWVLISVKRSLPIPKLGDCESIPSGAFAGCVAAPAGGKGGAAPPHRCATALVGRRPG